MVTGVLNVVVAVSATATGGRLIGVTVMTNVTGALVSMPPFAVPPLSWSVTVTVAEPFMPVAGVNVSVPFAEIAGCAENSDVLLFVTMKLTTCADSFAPALIPVAHAADFAPEFCVTVWFGPGVNVGTSLTALIVMTKVCAALVSAPPFAVPPLSCSDTVTVAVPLTLAAGL